MHTNGKTWLYVSMDQGSGFAIAASLTHCEPCAPAVWKSTGKRMRSKTEGSGGADGS